MMFSVLRMQHPNSGLIQLARTAEGFSSELLKPSAAAHPRIAAESEWRSAVPGLEPLRLPRTPGGTRRHQC